MHLRRNRQTGLIYSSLIIRPIPVLNRRNSAASCCKASGLTYETSRVTSRMLLGQWCSSLVLLFSYCMSASWLRLSLARKCIIFLFFCNWSPIKWRVVCFVGASEIWEYESTVNCALLRHHIYRRGLIAQEISGPTSFRRVPWFCVSLTTANFIISIRRLGARAPGLGLGSDRDRLKVHGKIIRTDSELQTYYWEQNKSISWHTFRNRSIRNRLQNVLTRDVITILTVKLLEHDG